MLDHSIYVTRKKRIFLSILAFTSADTFIFAIRNLYEWNAQKCRLLHLICTSYQIIVTTCFLSPFSLFFPFSFPRNSPYLSMFYLIMQLDFYNKIIKLMYVKSRINKLFHVERSILYRKLDRICMCWTNFPLFNKTKKLLFFRIISSTAIQWIFQRLHFYFSQCLRNKHPF